MKYLALIGGSLITQGILSIFITTKSSIAVFLIMAGIWLTMEGFAKGSKNE